MEVGRRIDYFSRGLLFSLCGHLLLALYFVFGAGMRFGEFQQPVVYSVTIEGGKTLGGMSQVAKDDKKIQTAPPKNVSEEQPKSQPEEKQVEKKITEDPKEAKAKEVEDAEVSLQEKKKEEEKKLKELEAKKKADEEKKKKEELAKKAKATPAPKKDDQAALNNNYQKALQRYLGESSDGGGKGFGAAKLGGAGMGGGVIRPPEFFIYKKALEQHIKAGWRWHNTTAALVAQVIIDIEADGKIRNVTLEKGSGNSEFDESVVRAVRKSSPVPIPPGTVYQWFKSVRMTFDPRQ